MNRFLLVLALFASASAQASAPGFSSDDSIRRMYTYGWCVVQVAPSQSRRILTVPPGSAEERALLRKIETDRCLSGQGQVFYIDFEPQMLRGVIAEVVLDADGGKGKLAPPFTGLTAATIATLDDRGRSALRALDFAACIAGAAPDAVGAVLETRPASSKEDRAFQQLGPHLSPCLPKGARMTLAKPQLRGFLAEAAYRAAYAAERSPEAAK
ncbi:MAG: hypothetical protein ACXWUJ_03260 [Allosphingosinicella sp.]